MKAFLVLAVALLASCGEQTPAEPRSRLALFAAARAQGIIPPPGPAWHLRAIGRVLFPAEPAPLQQDAEVWIGGPDRIKFVMTAAAGGGRNLFLLDGRAGCWLRTNADPWRDWGSSELLAESLLRWELLRFPWGWAEEIQSAAPGATRFTRSTDQGELMLDVDSHGLPQAASCGDVRAAVGDWRVVSQGQRTVPFLWTWTGPSGRRTEEYEELREDLRFFDEAFRPPPAESADKIQIVSETVERFGVIHARMWVLDGAASDPAAGDSSWWLHDARRVAAVLTDFDAPMPHSDANPSPQAAAEEWWLRWSFLSRTEDAAGAGADLLKAAEQAGLTVRGSPWLRETAADGRAHAQIAIVAVAAPH